MPCPDILCWIIHPRYHVPQLHAWVNGEAYDWHNVAGFAKTAVGSGVVPPRNDPA